LKKINFAIIACSKVAEKRFIPSLLKSEFGKLSFIGSREESKARAIAEKFGCSSYGNYIDALENPDIDAVYISTPTIFKKDLALKSSALGKHVIIEKPAFFNLKDAREVLQNFKKNKLQFQENWMFKFHPQHTEFKRLLKNNNFGKIKYFSSQFTYAAPPLGDIRLNPKLKGGVFYDSIGYPLLASLMIINEKPISIACSISNNKTHGVDDFVKIQLEFENGVFADLLSGFGLQYKSNYSTLCENGILTLNRAFAIDTDTKPTISIESNYEEKTIELDAADQFRLMIDSFCKKVNSKKIKSNLDEILFNQKIMDFAYLSASKKDIINL